MKSSYKTAYSVSAIALVLAGAAHADASKSTLDQWSVSSGNINATCPTGFSCGAALTDDGFYTRLIKEDGSGKQYFQTIVTMPGATATTQADLDKLVFADENFVSFSNNNGIIDKQRLYQKETLPIPLTPDTHDVIFRNGSVIGTGWAKDFVELTQHISDPAASGGDGFQTDFIFKQVGYADAPNNKFPTGKGMKLTSYVPLGPTAQGDKQDFVLVEMQGDFVAADGSVTLDGPPGTTLNWSGDTAAGANTGTKGDRIQALYIGEQLSVAGQAFGYTGYTNFAPSAVPGDAGKISTFSLSSGAVDPSWSIPMWGNLNTEGTITDPFPTVP